MTSEILAITTAGMVGSTLVAYFRRQGHDLSAIDMMVDLVLAKLQHLVPSATVWTTGAKA